MVEGDLKKYVLRLNSKKSLNYNIDRKRELEILNSIRNKSIGPKVVYSDDAYSFLILVHKTVHFQIDNVDNEGRFLYKIRHSGPWCGAP